MGCFICVEEDSMIDPDLIEKAECELADWVKRCHQNGLGYQAIYYIVRNDTPKIKMMAEAEKFVKEKKN